MRKFDPRQPANVEPEQEPRSSKHPVLQAPALSRSGVLTLQQTIGNRATPQSSVWPNGPLISRTFMSRPPSPG
jgi:hypothetical protein